MRWSLRLQASDRKAFSELFEFLHGPLLRYAVHLTQDEMQAYDVVQDVFLRLWSIRTELDPAKSLKALMYTMVRNRSLNHLQLVKSRQAGIEAMSTAMDPTVPAQAEDNLAAEALGKRIREWINELPPKRREAFRLSRFDGLTHEEIADVMEIAPRTVTNHIMLALQYVRDRLRVYRSEGG